MRARGDRVETFTLHNAAVEKYGPGFAVAAKTIWNRESVAAVGDAARAMHAEIVHFHNTFPLISPAAYQAASAAGAAVVQTLHNYRLLCPSATLFRDGHVCEDCVGKTVAWPSVQHACYRGSRAGSAAVAAMLTVHKARGTWRNDVDAYIALTDFARTKLIEGGLPEDRLFVKPNFIDPDPGVGDGRGDEIGPFAIFVGRLTDEKGVPTMLEAWKQVGSRLPLKILGDGPLRDDVHCRRGDQSGNSVPRQASDGGRFTVDAAGANARVSVRLVRGVAAHYRRIVCHRHAGRRFPSRLDGGIDQPRPKRDAV